MATLKSFSEISNMNQVERIVYLVNYFSNSPFMFTSNQVLSKAILGNQDAEVQSFTPAFIMSELAAKGFLGGGLDDTLITIINFNPYA